MLRVEDVRSIVDASVAAVREESRREIEMLVRRMRELEERVMKIDVSNSPTRSEDIDEHQGSVTPGALSRPHALIPLVSSAPVLNSPDAPTPTRTQDDYASPFDKSTAAHPTLATSTIQSEPIDTEMDVDRTEARSGDNSLARK